MQEQSDFVTIAIVQASVRALCRMHGYMKLADAEEILNTLIWIAAAAPIDRQHIDLAAYSCLDHARLKELLPPWAAD